MNQKKHPNVVILEKAVSFLGPMINEMVFIGGCATGLLITDPAATPVRSTIDVDVLVEVTSLVEYHKLSKRLRARGFAEDLIHEAPICRWTRENVILDVMPVNPDILGFGNKWYGPAFEASIWTQPSSGTKIRILQAPHFLATKLEAFDGRGNQDYLLSRDMEDVIAVLDGRPEIIEEVKISDTPLKNYLQARMNSLLNNNSFLEALPGHLPPDPASQARTRLVLERMQEISDI